jgi:hypothetical protein
VRDGAHGMSGDPADNTDCRDGIREEKPKARAVRWSRCMRPTTWLAAKRISVRS